MEDILTPHNFFLNRDAILQAVEFFKTQMTMNVVKKILGVEPVPTQIVSPLPPSKINMDLALVSSSQANVVPAAVEDASILEENLKVAIVRTVINPGRSSPAKEVVGGLKQKNSHLA